MSIPNPVKTILYQSRDRAKPQIFKGLSKTGPFIEFVTSPTSGIYAKLPITSPFQNTKKITKFLNDFPFYDSRICLFH